VKVCSRVDNPTFAMKSNLCVLFFVLSQALDLRILGEPNPKPSPEVLTIASLEVIWTEIKHRIEECGKSDGPLANLPLYGLQTELARRAAKKECTPEPEEPPPSKAAPPAPAPVTNQTTTTTTTTTTCPDNFMDELVDQANVDFDMLDQNKDGCIDKDEMSSSLENMLRVNKDKAQYYWNSVSEQGQNLTDMVERQIRTNDKDGDGCLNKEEFHHVRFSMCDCPAQFKLMDHSGDGKVSETEASRYVNNHMEHADLSLDKFNAIFAAADADKDGFINESEFCTAGPRYKGDGNNEKSF